MLFSSEKPANLATTFSRLDSAIAHNEDTLPISIRYSFGNGPVQFGCNEKELYRYISNLVVLDVIII